MLIQLTIKNEFESIVFWCVTPYIVLVVNRLLYTWVRAS